MKKSNEIKQIPVNPKDLALEKLLDASERYSKGETSSKELERAEIEYKQVTEMYKFTTG